MRLSPFTHTRLNKSMWQFAGAFVRSSTCHLSLPPQNVSSQLFTEHYIPEHLFVPSERKCIVIELLMMWHYADTRLTLSSGISEVDKWLIVLTWKHHADISAYIIAEDPNKQCRRRAGWADKAEQTTALTVCRAYLHNVFSTNGYMIIQSLCGCLKRGHTSKPPDSSFLSALHLIHWAHERDFSRVLSMRCWGDRSLNR